MVRTAALDILVEVCLEGTPMARLMDAADSL